MKGKDIKEFTLGAVKWTVKFDNDKMSERKAIGTASFTESTIYLADKHDGIDIPPDLIDQVLLEIKKEENQNKVLVLLTKN